MPRYVDVKFELPDEVVPNLRDEDLSAKAKEALTMELLREHAISQGKAAELLGIDRHQLFDLMTNDRHDAGGAAAGTPASPCDLPGETPMICR